MNTRARSVSFYVSIIFVVILIAYVAWKFIFPFLPHALELGSKPLCKDCNVVLITLDVCTARNMPCYGYDRDTTPNLCAYAKNNQLFLNSFANGIWTLPSHVSLLTGVLPSTHGVNQMWISSLAADRPFLPDILHQNGYKTILFQDKDSGIFPKDLVYNRGISEIKDVFDIRDIFTQLEAGKKEQKKVFVSFYISSCHEPNIIGAQEKLFTTASYPEIPTEKFDSWKEFPKSFYDYMMVKLPKSLKNHAFTSKNDAVQELYEEMLKAKTYENTKKIFIQKTQALDYSIVNNLYWSYIYENFINIKDKNLMEYLRAIYDQKLVQIDENEMKNFIEAINASDFKKNTIVLITAEHGQEFGEHDMFGHTTLYDRNLRVPFILSVPGLNPQEYTTPVQGIDVTPTILDLVGIQHQFSFEGRSIVPILQNKNFEDRYIISDRDAGDQKAIQKGEWKLLVLRQKKNYIPYELYNIKEDPNEQNNLIYSKSDIARKMLRESNVHISTSKTAP